MIEKQGDRQMFEKKGAKERLCKSESENQRRWRNRKDGWAGLAGDDGQKVR